VPRSRRISDNETSRHRFATTDVFWALVVVAWTAFGIAAMVRDIGEYRWQQRVIADFGARTPKMADEALPDSAADERLIGEAAGGVIAIGAAVFAMKRRRHVAAELRVKWTAAPPKRAPPVEVARAASGPAVPSRAEPRHKLKSGSLAADRLSVVVWSDHVARMEKEHA
jgi:hypothetical protein